MLLRKGSWADREAGNSWGPESYIVAVWCKPVTPCSRFCVLVHTHSLRQQHCGTALSYSGFTWTGSLACPKNACAIYSQFP
jgi:hypothetical protein